MKLTDGAAGQFRHALGRVFKGVSDEFIEQLLDNTSLVHLDAGELLYRCGDPVTGLHIVHTGRLQVRVPDGDDGGEKVVNVCGPGDVVGEIALYTGGTRAASLIALRDTTLGYVPKASFDALMTQRPEAQREVSRYIIQRLLDAQMRPRSDSRTTRTLALVPLEETLDITAFARRLQVALLRFGSATRFSRSMVTARFGSDLDGTSSSGVADLEHHLETLEATHDFTLLEAEAHASAWTRKCVSFADEVVFVARAAGHVVEAAERVGQIRDDWDRPERSCDLVLLHARGDATPSGTRSWLEAVPSARHHHVALDGDSGFGRLARVYSGNAVSLVLGGGGARGFAHLGVIRALREAGIPIDLVAGTSLGAIVGGGVAMGWNDARMIHEYKTAFVDADPARDYSVPVFSLIRGQQVSAGLRRHFGDTLIEDLWIPFLAVSTNLSSGEEFVHRSGLLWRALRATASLPAILPPVIQDSEILVDGGILNNLPVNVARGVLDGYVIAVDISAADEFTYDQTDLPTLAEYLRARLLSPISAASLPTIQRVVLRSTMISSRRQAQLAREQSELYLAPPTSDFDLLDWQRMPEICEQGYLESRADVAAWSRKHENLIDHGDALASFLQQQAPA